MECGRAASSFALTLNHLRPGPTRHRPVPEGQARQRRNHLSKPRPVARWRSAIESVLPISCYAPDLRRCSRTALACWPKRARAGVTGVATSRTIHQPLKIARDTFPSGGNTDEDAYNCHCRSSRARGLWLHFDARGIVGRRYRRTDGRSCWRPDRRRGRCGRRCSCSASDRRPLAWPTATRPATPITSAGRFSPLGPLGISGLYDGRV